MRKAPGAADRECPGLWPRLLLEGNDRRFRDTACGRRPDHHHHDGGQAVVSGQDAAGTESLQEGSEETFADFNTAIALGERAAKQLILYHLAV